MYKCYRIPQRITFERSYDFSILQYCPKETPTQVFPCEYNEIFKNTYFEEYLQIIVSELAICSVLFIHSYLYLSSKNSYWEPNVQSLTLYALTSQNCQTHLNSSSADEFFGVLDYFVGLALNWLKQLIHHENVPDGQLIQGFWCNDMGIPKESLRQRLVLPHLLARSTCDR